VYVRVYMHVCVCACSSRVSQEQQVEQGVRPAEVDQRPAEDPAAQREQGQTGREHQAGPDQRAAAAPLGHLGDGGQEDRREDGGQTGGQMVGRGTDGRTGTGDRQ